MVRGLENGIDSEFSVGVAWESLRQKSVKVPWVQVVWFFNAIPRHYFFMWLIMLQKLKTQDKVRLWEKNPNANLPTVCVLCDKEEDSHSHFFFECEYARKLRFNFCGLANIESIKERWDDIIQHLLTTLFQKSVRSNIGRLTVREDAYFVWHERNLRLFKKGKRLVEQVFKVVHEILYSKIMSFNLKENTRTKSALKAWNIEETELAF